MAGTLTYDNTTPTPPEGSQCMMAEVTSGSANAYITRSRVNAKTSFVHQHLYVDAEGLADTEEFKTLQVLDSSDNIAAYIRIYDDSGTLKYDFYCYDGSLTAKVTGQTLSLQTWYEFEYKYDIDGEAWELRLDGSSVDSGSIGGATRTPRKVSTGIIGCTGSGTTRVYIDDVVWRTDNWQSAYVTSGSLALSVISSLSDTALASSSGSLSLAALLALSEIGLGSTYGALGLGAISTTSQSSLASALSSLTLSGIATEQHIGVADSAGLLSLQAIATIAQVGANVILASLALGASAGQSQLSIATAVGDTTLAGGLGLSNQGTAQTLATVSMPVSAVITESAIAQAIADTSLGAILTQAQTGSLGAIVAATFAAAAQAGLITSATKTVTVATTFDVGGESVPDTLLDVDGRLYRRINDKLIPL